MNEEYIVTRINPTHFKDLQYISKAAFGISVPENYFEHKWNTAFTGVQNIGYIAHSMQGEPAGYYGVFPCFVEYNGKKYLAAQSGDTMTHPKHTGKGLFTSLAKKTYELAALEGIEFVFGFPNDNSYPGFVKKLNWIHKENMVEYFIPIKTIPFAGLVKKFRFLYPLFKFYLNSIFSFYKSKLSFLKNSVIEPDVIGIHKDESFFKYKSFQNNYLLNIKGLDIWLKSDGYLLVGDVSKFKDTDISLFIKSLKQLAFWTGHPKIRFSVSKGTWLDLLLENKFTKSEGAYIGYVNFNSSLPLERMKFTLSDFDTF